MVVQGPEGFQNTADAVLENTRTRDVVKSFNFTGAENIVDPQYGEHALDMFVAGDSVRGCVVAAQLARDVGFGECYAIGGNDKFTLMEQFALFWINLAMFQGMGCGIGFKLLRRQSELPMNRLQKILQEVVRTLMRRRFGSVRSFVEVMDQVLEISIQICDGTAYRHLQGPGSPMCIAFSFHPRAGFAQRGIAAGP